MLLCFQKLKGKKVFKYSFFRKFRNIKGKHRFACYLEREMNVIEQTSIYRVIGQGHYY